MCNTLECYASGHTHGVLMQDAMNAFDRIHSTPDKLQSVQFHHDNTTFSNVLCCAGTNKRPVPLEHNVYYAGEIYPVMSGDSTFNADGIRRAAAAHRKKTNPEATKPAGAAGGGGRGGAAAARPTGRGQSQGPNRGGGGGGGGGRGYGGRGGGADNFRRQLQGAVLGCCDWCLWRVGVHVG
jgi:hypothetical protein